MLKEMMAQGALEYLTGEPYPVTPAGRDQALFVIDRAAAPLLESGLFGQHVNGLCVLRTALRCGSVNARPTAVPR